MSNNQNGILEYDLKDMQNAAPDKVVYLDGDVLIAPLSNSEHGRKPARSSMYTLITCITGQLNVSLNGNPYAMQQGDMLFCLPNVIISDTSMSHDFTGGLLCMTNRIVLGLLGPHITIWNHALYVQRKLLYHIKSSDAVNLQHYTNLLECKMAEKDNPFRVEIVQSVLRAILFEMCAHMRLYKDKEHNSIPVTQAERLFNRFLDMLSAEKMKKRPVYYYADKLCISSKYLSVVCKQMSDRTASEWIENYLEEDIRYLLCNTDKPLKEVSVTLNFPNLSFFGKYVRLHFGCTPSQLRKQG